MTPNNTDQHTSVKDQLAVAINDLSGVPEEKQHTSLTEALTSSANPLSDQNKILTKVTILTISVGSVSLIIILLLMYWEILPFNNVTAWIFAIGPTILSIITALIYLIPRRDNPNNVIYYFTHKSSFPLVLGVALLFWIPFLILFYFFAQCRDYSVSIGFDYACIQKIIHGGH
jgi:hypothetical protein